MATVSQTIPNYYGGLSEQPDELKIPGQVNKLINTLPDITHGLLKRPGGRLIGANMSSYTTSSKWFHYYRDENEQYIGQIELSTGNTKMWRCDTGAAVTVSYAPLAWSSGTTYAAYTEVSNSSKIYKATTESAGGSAPTHSSGTTGNWEYVTTTSARETNLKNYLKTVPADGSAITDSDIQTLTLNDYTYITNRNKIPAMAGGATAPIRNPEAYIELKKVAYASQYAVNLFDTTATTDVYTATRIGVEREIDSRNACKSNGHLPSSGNLPGSDGSTRCNAGGNENDDDTMPNVGTKIFSVDHGYVNASNSPAGADANDTAWTMTVTPNGGSASDRKNLFFRITTTGQPVAEGDSSQPEYYSRYTTTHDLLYGGEGWRTGDYFYVWLKNAKYKITVEQHSVGQIQCNLGKIRPEPTSFDTKTAVTAESILSDIRRGILGDSNGGVNDLYEWKHDIGNDYYVQQVGNGLYISRPTAQGTFNLNTPVGDLLNVFTNSVKDVADLPSQCKHGYVVRIANSVADEDDYYVNFVGQNERDGEGVWEECPEPGRNVAFAPDTMPIQMRRESTGTFTIAPNDWENCLVGDTVTVPEPSFVGNSINKMLFFRNRMVLLSDENVIMSRPGDFFNFWPKTAVTYTAADNVDISCSSEYPAIVYDGIQVNTGLLLFTKNQQFMLTTDSDVLSPNTAKINALATYNFNSKTNPISMGTTVAFLDNGGKYSRFFEITAVLREGQPEVLEQSKAVSKSFPNDINVIANSRENSVIFFAKTGDSKVYAYRYFSGIERRLQQAWFQWELSGAIQHMAMLDDALYVVIRNKGADVLQKFSIKIDDDSNTLIDDQGTLTDDSDDVTYRVHLDNAVVIASSALAAPTGNPEYTSFACPAGFNKTNLSGTYTRALKVITVTSTAHEFTVGQRVNLEFTTGGATDGEYTVLTSTANTFTVEDTVSGTISSSNVTINAVSAAIIVADGDDKTLQGVYAKTTSYTDSGTRIKLPGNWKTYQDASDTTITPTNNIIFGYLFDMEVQFPTIYKQDRVGDFTYKADIHSTLILHRVKFSFGPLGVYDVVVKKTGKDTYTETFEALASDAYVTNTISFEADKKATIPIYEKNINLELAMKSTHPSPATLYSLTWEGDYTDGYYKRV